MLDTNTQPPAPLSHTNNPPHTWTVVKAAERVWQVRDNDGGVRTSAKTKREATELLTSGFYFKLWHDRDAWYKGHTPTGHNSWIDEHARQERIRIKWAK